MIKHVAYSVLVDYEMSIKKEIERGKYNWVNSNITQKKFPTKKKGKFEVEITLFYFNRYISGKDALKEINKAGYRPAELRELLALEANCSDFQKKLLIVAFDSMRWFLFKHCKAICLYGGSSGYRGLGLIRLNRSWGATCFFAVVRR